ncbi:FKBP-type peptidyl-prolyl cis-trans isomerase [Polaromonas sp.]|nr:FKBP-type peptidyl-prolyl cis-trans isomerase [Candidatus Saccharibacteria bacterium]
MTKTKIVAGVVVLIVLAGAGGGVVLIKSKHQTASTLGAATESQSSIVASDLNPQTNASSSISLNQNFDTPEAGGLAISSNTSSNSATQAAGTQQPSGPGQSTSSTSGGSSNPFDPSTYMQYEKYKNDQGGLFADVQVGTGATLEANKKAAVYYRGWLTNGTKFDESRTGADGKLAPFVFTLGSHQVITG